MSDVTRILEAAHQGDPNAADQLLPLVYEELRRLGEVAILLAELDKAEQWLSQALALRKKVFGEEHAEVANSLDSLALALYGQGRLAEAEQMGRDALAMQRKTRGNSHTNVATSLNNLGIILTVAGEFDAALEAYVEALNIRTNRLGPEHTEVAVTLNCLAQALHGKGNLRDAESAQRVALAIQRKVLPDPHPDLALSLNNLANLLQVQGKLDQDAGLYAENLRMLDLLKGDPTELATTLNNYGLLLERMGLWAESESVHSKAFSIRTNAYRGDHPHVAFSLNNLASLRPTRADSRRPKPCIRTHWPCAEGCTVKTTLTWRRPSPIGRAHFDSKAGWRKPSRCRTTRWPGARSSRRQANICTSPFP